MLQLMHRGLVSKSLNASHRLPKDEAMDILHERVLIVSLGDHAEMPMGLTYVPVK